MRFVILFVCCFTVVYGGISGERVSVDPANPDVCVSKDPGVGVMKVGETKTIQGRCVRASCGKGWIEYAGCGTISPPEGCTVGAADFSKPYYECCPKIVCP